MALGDPYITLAELKQYMGQAGTMANDDELTDALETASSQINKHCNRQFNQATVATARLFKPRDQFTIMPDDFWTDDELVIEYDPSGGANNVFQIMDPNWYELTPLNGVVDGEPGWPVSKVRIVNGLWLPRSYTNRREGTVRITAKWGWETVPAPVKTACKIMAQETFKIRDAPFGVAGINNFGILRVRDNPMAAAKLQKYVLNPVLVG